MSPVDATECGDCEKSLDLGVLPGRKVLWQWYFFWRYCTFFNHQIFPDSGPKIRKCFPKDLMLWHGQAQTVLLPYDFCLLRVFGSNSRRHHNNLGTLFLEL